MGGAVAITRVDLTAAELRAAAGPEKNGSVAGPPSSIDPLYLSVQRSADRSTWCR